MLAAFFAIYFFWGTTFFAVRFVVPVVPPLITISIRCLGGAMILWAWVVHRGEARWPTLDQWKRAALVGCVLFPCSQALLATGLKTVSSGQAALVSATIPLWLVVLQCLRRRTLPSRMVVFGLVLGMAGVAVLVGGSALNSGTPLARALLIVAAFNWSLGSLLGRGGARPLSVAQGSAMQLTTGGIAVLIAGTVRGDLASVHASAITPSIVAAFAFLVICGTVLGFGAYTWLLQVTSAALVGSYAFVNPIVALGLGWLVGDDQISARVIVAAVLVIGAVVLTTLATPAPSEQPSAG
jgi:drug/metabolite transporter (DMT)-like permease